MLKYVLFSIRSGYYDFSVYFNVFESVSVFRHWNDWSNIKVSASCLFNSLPTSF